MGTERIDFLEPRLFINQDMIYGVSLELADGTAAIFSACSPQKNNANDDSAAIIPVGKNGAILAIADGVGGHRDGAAASAVALQAIIEAVAEAERIGAELREAILNGIERANKAVLKLGTGAATTLALVEVNGSQVRSYHVGDSLVLITGNRGKIKLKTISHSPVGYAEEAGLIDADAAMFHDERHVVSNVIGSTEMRIELGPVIELSPRDTLVLSSDGLSDNLHLKEIIEHVRKGALNDVAQELADEAEKRMTKASKDTPSKPDDLTFIVYRPR